MRVRPTGNWKLLGTDAELETQVDYEARWAQNQPDWQDKRKLFVDHPEPVGFLLSQGEYVITEPDRPVNIDRVIRTLQDWMCAVEIPCHEDDGEEGQILLTDSGMLQLIQQTRSCIEDLKLSTNE